LSACPECKGKYHVYDDAKGGWVRCECLKRKVAIEIKQARTKTVPEGVEPVEDAALDEYHSKSVTLISQDLRLSMAYVVRCADAAWAKTELVCMHAPELVEVTFQRSTLFERETDVAEVGWLAMMIGYANISNKLLPELIERVLIVRSMYARPTWVLTPFFPGRVKSDFSEQISRLIFSDQKAFQVSLRGLKAYNVTSEEENGGAESD